MADINCMAIVHWQDGVVLVRDSPKAKWRLPAKSLADDEGPILCVRRCVLAQTGYRAQVLRLFKIVTKGKGEQRGVDFVFGCKIEPVQLQQPDVEVATFTPNEIIKLADVGLFDDRFILQLIDNYKNQLPTPVNEFAEQSA